MTNSIDSTILIDAHVHIYKCFKINVLLDSAYSNFTNAAKVKAPGNEFIAILLLAETSSDNWFNQTFESCKKHSQQALKNGNHWGFYITNDKNVIKAQKLNRVTDAVESIYIIAGRQIITAEGLELLALATNKMFEDGLSMSSSLQKVRGEQAIPVLPWAVGKWLGKRGKFLSQILNTDAYSDLCLGDNSGRPVFWHNPSHFQQGQKRRLKLLPGTDPLPIANEENRVGSFGLMLNGKLSSEFPSEDLKKIINDKTTKIKTYGQLESTYKFFSNQIRLRIA